MSASHVRLRRPKSSARPQSAPPWCRETFRKFVVLSEVGETMARACCSSFASNLVGAYLPRPLHLLHLFLLWFAAHSGMGRRLLLSFYVLLRIFNVAFSDLHDNHNRVERARHLLLGGCLPYDMSALERYLPKPLKS
ncbi:unnamed protein product [Ostreobium quekettii]|uniref:Uncharacterized protein n=1 Tax=Ostreobium quekettii TaxID=121088 RepID=A0A8S1IPJ1_9CHLO|nr:unnamed protein product [Ostreobium quekettii]